MTPNQSEIASNLAFNQQSLLLFELEFIKMFLAYSYVGRRKLEDVISVQDAIDIISMKTGSMFDFEAKISAQYGRANCEPSDRVMHLDWDSGKTYLYHCYVSMDGTYWELGDDNMLIVQFTDHLDPDMPFYQQRWIAARQTISDKISIGTMDCGRHENQVTTKWCKPEAKLVRLGFKFTLQRQGIRASTETGLATLVLFILDDIGSTEFTIYVLPVRYLVNIVQLLNPLPKGWSIQTDDDDDDPDDF
nr:probable RNA-dependent RNA polymerase 5 [Tanacetum cinerariifolium]